MVSQGLGIRVKKKIKIHSISHNFSACAKYCGLIIFWERIFFKKQEESLLFCLGC